jgi:sugar lactone lactonase YvrE
MRFALPILLLVLRASAQNFDGVQVDKVATGLLFAEGPAWSRDGFLVFSDVPNNKLLDFRPIEKKTGLVRANSNGAMGNAFDAQGRWCGERVAAHRN